MYSYVSLSQIKSKGWLNITGTDWDTDLLRIAQDMSRDIDSLTNTHFYCYEGIRYYDGAANILILDDDLLSISALALDINGTQVYGTTMVPADYIAYPLNLYPKRWLRTSHSSSQSNFASGIRSGVKITGVFGYADTPTPYTDSGAVLNTGGMTDSATTHALATGKGASFSAGQTIRVESEQMYITAVATDTLTVMRGSNGTTAAAHVAGKVIYTYYYYPPIMEATLIQISRLWKRRESAFQNAVGSAELGQLIVYKGLDEDVKLRIQRSMRRTF
jgi:hypothetical protein